MKILTIANPKGGVAKSTLALHLAYRAAELNKKVIVIDFDMQGSISGSLEQNQAIKHEETAAALFMKLDAKPRNSIFKGIDILSASSKQGEILNNFSCSGVEELKDFTESFKSKFCSYDLVIIDTAGVLGFKPPLTTAALLVSDFVLMPTTIGNYETLSLAKSFKYINAIRKNHNQNLNLVGIVPCRVNSVSKIEVQALSNLKQQLPMVLDFHLTERAAVKQAIALKKPVWVSPKGESGKKAANEWIAVTNDVLNKIGLFV